jgi:lipopolysaccharide export system permease protein
MGAIGFYIFRTTLAAFLLVLASLTAIIWVSYALRDIDLMTSQGQTILTFIEITSLVVPQLVLVIAPVAFVIAVSQILTKLASDSEIIVMNAAGMSPWLLFRAFFAAAVMVSLLVLFVSAYLSPECLRTLRRWATEVRADVVANIVQPGRFLTLEPGLLFHIRERQPNGVLVGIFVDDHRNQQEQVTLLAEQGQIAEINGAQFLVLQHGSVQRRRAAERDPTIVNFDTYAFDLSSFSHGSHTLAYPARERYTWELVSPPADDPVFLKEPGEFRAELHDRIVTPLYPLAFVVIAYVYLGAPRTTRQNRAMAMVSAILVVAALRLAGFVSIVGGSHSTIMLSIQYIALAVVFVLGSVGIHRGLLIEPPAWFTNFVAVMTERIQRRFATS